MTDGDSDLQVSITNVNETVEALGHDFTELQVSTMTDGDELETLKHGFTDLRVSTMTATCSLKTTANIIAIAKYAELDDVLIGIKLHYAKGSAAILRGTARPSKKNGCIYTQVTFTMRLPSDPPSIVSCKVFSNGSVQLAGVHSLAEAVRTVDLLVEKIKNISGIKIIELESFDNVFKTYDNLVMSSRGTVIGWKKDHLLHIGDEYVELQKVEGYPVLQSTKWIDNRKNVYTLDGQLIGSRTLHFDQARARSRKNFDVKYGYIYAGERIVGKEKIEYDEGFRETLQACTDRRQVCQEQRAVVHRYVAFDDKDAIAKVAESDFSIHMINMYCQAPFHLSRTLLQQTFLEENLTSKNEPSSNPALNLRFKYNFTESGRCLCTDARMCTCREISVSCFTTGKINITGLRTFEQGKVVYDFLCDFFTRHRSKFEKQIEDLKDRKISIVS